MDLTLMRHLSQDLVAFLIGKLYEDAGFMYKALEIINNITREKPGTTVDIFIKYEIDSARPADSQGPLMNWLMQRTKNNLPAPKVYDAILELLTNLTASDDGNILFLSQHRLDDILHSLFSMTNPLDYRSEARLCSILSNLANSYPYGFGAWFLLSPWESVLDRMRGNILAKDCKVRKEALILFGLLVGKAADAESKQAVLDRYGLMQQVL